MRPEQKRNLQAYADYLAANLGRPVSGATEWHGRPTATLFVGRNVDALAPIGVKLDRAIERLAARCRRS